MDLKPPFGSAGPRVLLWSPLLWLLVVFALVFGGVYSTVRSGGETKPAGTPESTVVARVDQPALVALAEATPASEPTAPAIPVQTPQTENVSPTPTATRSAQPQAAASTQTVPLAQPSSVHLWPLAGKHAQAPCASCHVGIAKPSSICSACHSRPEALHAQSPHNLAACDTCHKSPGRSWAVATQTCVVCHSDRQQHFPTRECGTCHAFKAGAVAFQHPTPLSGKHATTPCESCHTSAAKPATSCSTCHQQTGGALHAQASHAAANCASCHGTASAAWTGVGEQACASCHADKKEHYPGVACASCHAFTGKGITYQHTWALAGKHQNAACKTCHTSAAKPDASCATCHKQSAGLHASAPHASPACSTCHGTSISGWKGVSQQTCTGSCHTNKAGHYPTQACSTCHSFTGQTAGYKHAWPLAGKHAATGCKSCHTGAGKPDPTCASCHKTTGGALHTSASHAKGSCESCHGTAATGWSGVSPQSCQSCHGDRSKHYPGNSCQSCHAFTPKGTTFQHTGWPLSGKHQAATCSRCHTSSTKPSTACSSCHKAPTVELHRKDDHTRNSCQTCHGATYTTWAVERQACLNCHAKDSDYGEKKVHSTTTAVCQSCHRFK